MASLQTPQAPGEGDELLIVKVEDSSWELDSAQLVDSTDSETCRQRFRQFRYRDVGGPHEAFSRLWELCCRWLRPELRSKEQILELLVLEQFLSALPGDIQARLRGQCLGSGEEAVALVEDLQKKSQDVASEEAEPEAAARGPRAEGALPTAGAESRPSVPHERLPVGLGSRSQRARPQLEEAVTALSGGASEAATASWNSKEAEAWEENQPGAAPGGLLGARRGRPPSQRQFPDLATEKPHICGRCGKRFRWGSDLARHQRTHTGERPHKCPECDKSFRSSSDLLRHQGVHTGKKPFSCPDCGKSFSRSAYLADHQRIHTGEKPFGCGDCGKSFSLRSYLLDHRRVHTGERPFGCGDCGKSFKQRAHLMAHQSLHAKVDPPVE